MDLQNIEKITFSLEKFCESEKFKGWDPYDGLNSKIFRLTPLKYSKLFRLIWIQFFKRNCVNFRKLFLVPKDYNSKGLGLFLSAYCNLYKIYQTEEYKSKIFFLTQKLKELQNNNYNGACWGYNFDWQARAFFQPKNTPTVVATSFITYAFLDAYDIFKNSEWLDIARSSCNFILKDLNKTFDNEGDFAFSYSPLDQTTVFNATLLASKTLARVYFYTGEKELFENSRKSVSFACKYQNADGSWTYSTLPFHQWIDNFHTGFNLEAIAEYQKYTHDYSFVTNLEKGVNFYVKNFFLENGIPKYYHNKIYPIDIHSPAQLIVTLIRTNYFSEYKHLLNSVLNWTIENMYDYEKNYFYYQIRKGGKKCRIPYMRWAQAWMLYSLSFLLLELKNNLYDDI